MDINPLELLKEEMENDDVAIRVNAMHRLKIVAAILGPEGIKQQLLPYLDQLLKKEEDEVLFAIADELNNIAPLLQQQQTILVPFLENLAAQEETVVREKAVSTLITMSKTLNDNDIQNVYIPMILRLANNDQNFTCRVSAVNLMVPIYQRAGQNKDKIRQKIIELCQEETPMVRRCVASKIGEFALVVEKEYVVTELIQSVKQLIQDEQDQVRVLGLNSLKLVAKVLTKEENKQQTLTIIIAATEDKSWRVRLSLSKIFSELAEAFGKEVSDVSLIQQFINLLRDSENEVRAASIVSLAKFIKIMSIEKLTIIVPHIQYLVKDSVPEVRAGTAEVIAILSGLINKEQAVTKLQPLLPDLFNDEQKEVREAASKATAKFCENVGPESIDVFIAMFKKALEDPKWRVRAETMEGLINLAKKFPQPPELFKSKLEPLIMMYLKEKASVVREIAIDRIPQLMQTYKNEWVFNRLVPKIQEALDKQNSYLYRMSALRSLKQIAKNLSSGDTQEKIMPIFYKHINDEVPNIRMLLIQIFKELSQKFDSNPIKSDMKQQIQILANDPDKGVKQYATDMLQGF